MNNHVIEAYKNALVLNSHKMLNREITTAVYNFHERAILNLIKFESHLQINGTKRENKP